VLVDDAFAVLLDELTALRRQKIDDRLGRAEEPDSSQSRRLAG
jgi:hypothetical protein